YEAVLRIGDEILKLCADAGGSVTGEHGIGLEKRENIRYVFSDDDLEVMERIRRVFDPDELMNPGKVFPSDGLKASLPPQSPGVARRHPATVAGSEDVWV
ncbi:MAG TPA: FAD-linked oxidase C-terminal domain-containing protein, partial [Candidatus Angelobacter sp.]|nr:FAD-linked oxidase C-terminal domain-containing protein [Candidatus Angelobacter sp.]